MDQKLSDSFEGEDKISANFLTSNYAHQREKKTCDFAKVLFDIKISLSCLHYNVIIN